jgi:thioredoxin-related protein
MKHLISAALAVSMVAGVVLAAGAANGSEPGLEGFKRTYADALAAAKVADKPLYIHFTTTWCGWCRKIEKEVYASDEGKKVLANFVPATLDCTVEKSGKPGEQAKINMALMQMYGMSGYPSLIIMTADGAVLESWAGYVPIDGFKARLERANKGLAEYRAFQKEADAADKNNYEFNVKAMTTYRKYQKWDSAAEAAQQIRTLDADNKMGNAATASYVLWRAGKAGGMTADKLAARLNDVKTFDPKNEKGALELAMFEQASSQAQTGKIQECIATLNELTSKAAKLNDGQQVYLLLGQAQAGAGDFAAAKASIEKAIAIDPKSPNAARLKAILKQIQDQADKSKK